MGLYVGGKEIKDLYVGSKKVVGAYVGKQLVRPTVFEYSYDFRNKSTSQITDDGWQVIQGTPSFNSSGIRTLSTDWMLKIVNKVEGLSENIATCKKLIIEYTRYTTGAAAFECSVINYSGGAMSNSTGIYQDNRLGDWAVYGAGDRIMSPSGGTISGTVKYRGEYDLEKKTVAISWNGGTETTAILTDSEITNIKSNTNSVYVYFWGNPSITGSWGFSDLSITIKNS